MAVREEEWVTVVGECNCRRSIGYVDAYEKAGGRLAEGSVERYD